MSSVKTHGEVPRDVHLYRLGLDESDRVLKGPPKQMEISGTDFRALASFFASGSRTHRQRPGTGF